MTRLKQSITPCGKPFEPSSCHRASISDNFTNPVRLSSIISNKVRILDTNFFGKFSNGLEPLAPFALDCELKLFIPLKLLPLCDNCGAVNCAIVNFSADCPSLTTFNGGTNFVAGFRFIFNYSIDCAF